MAVAPSSVFSNFAKNASIEGRLQRWCYLRMIAPKNEALVEHYS